MTCTDHNIQCLQTPRSQVPDSSMLSVPLPEFRQLNILWREAGVLLGQCANLPSRSPIGDTRLLQAVRLFHSSSQSMYRLCFRFVSEHSLPFQVSPAFAPKEYSCQPTPLPLIR